MNSIIITCLKLRIEKFARNYVDPWGDVDVAGSSRLLLVIKFINLLCQLKHGAPTIILEIERLRAEIKI